ncbi:MAG TPA: hypothetical protein PLG88_04570, partial [Chitinophagaceae bacterium]|nr:hypothetical protein [Chitinophagaceae bacterium]
MTCKHSLLILLFFSFGLVCFGQKIIYSQPDKNDLRRMNFIIGGKINGNFLIYKNIRNDNTISVLDENMQEISNVEQDYLPNNDKIINVDVFVHQQTCYVIYQYQKKNVVYCMAARTDGLGHLVGDVVELDTTHLRFAANNDIYTVINSEDKTKFGVFKVDSRNKKLFVLTTLLFNDQLELQNKSVMDIPMEGKNDNLGIFEIDNEGNFVFTKIHRRTNENIDEALLYVKPAMAERLDTFRLHLNDLWLDDIQLKIDNANQRYLLTSLYMDGKRGNIQGLYFYIMNQANQIVDIEKTVPFNDSFREEAKGDAATKSAFNDYFIRNIITRKDGGFVLGSESYYTTSRYNSWNRWDYLYGSPYWNYSASWYRSPFYRNYWWYYRNDDRNNTRYHADNIAVMSFDKDANPEWYTVIGKSQYDDNSDNTVSYQMMNTGKDLHFLFNKKERRTTLLNDYSLLPTGKLARNPTLKNLERGYEFMPKYGKQVSATQM